MSKINMKMVATDLITLLLFSLKFQSVQSSQLRRRNTVDLYPLIDTRIVGGVRVHEESKYPNYGFPAGSHNCGATLIHEDIMLSAGHCFSFFKEAGVYLGGNQISGSTSSLIQVDYEVRHPDYNEETLANDILLIKLSTPRSETPVKLNFDPARPAVGDDLTVIGYGALTEDGTYSMDLMEVEVITAKSKRCSKVYDNYNDEGMLCAWYPGGGKDSCQGDSGGPLFLSETGEQVALVSFGEGCAREEFPSANTRISSFKKFIQDGICEHSSNPPTHCHLASADDAESHADSTNLENDHPSADKHH